MNIQLNSFFKKLKDILSLYFRIHTTTQLTYYKMQRSIELLADTLNKIQKEVDEKCKCYYKHHHMPIKTICGIPVYARVDINRKYMTFKIEAKNAGKYDSECDYENVQMYGIGVMDSDNCGLEMATKIMEALPKLKYDKFESKFTVEEPNSATMEMYQPLMENGLIDFTFGKCAVCLEYTKSTTVCGHHLCVQCWGKIKATEYCHESNRGRRECECAPYECGIKKCPICRQNMEYSGDSEDEDEDD